MTRKPRRKTIQGRVLRWAMDYRRHYAIQGISAPPFVLVGTIGHHALHTHEWHNLCGWPIKLAESLALRHPDGSSCQ